MSSEKLLTEEDIRRIVREEIARFAEEFSRFLDGADDEPHQTDDASLARE